MKKKAFSLLLSLLLVLSMLAPLGVVSFACWPHIYDDGVVATEPTCGTDGVLTYTCADCNYSFDVTLPASGEHVYDEPFITAEPTCGTPGVLTYICTVCGYVYNEPIPASGAHLFDGGDITTEPTDGLATRTCLNDPSHTETQVLPALSGQSGQPQPQPDPQPSGSGTGTSSFIRIFHDFIQIIMDFLSSFFNI